MSKTRMVQFLRIIPVLLIILAMVPLSSIGAYNPPSNANLQIMAVEINPQPARPGEDMFIKINIENYGNSAAEDVIVELEENFPFRFKYHNIEHDYLHNTNTTIRIPKISAYGHYEAFYYFTVDSQAKSGEYELGFRISRTKEGILGLVKNFKIDVEGTPDLTLVNSSFSSTNIEPGDEFTLKTTVVSVGTGNAKNIRISLSLDDNSTIIPLEDSSIFIPRLDAGEPMTVEFKLQLSQDAPTTSYNIPIQITGFDETESIRINSYEMIGFDALARANLNIASIKTEPVIGTTGNDLKLSVRIENVGLGEATSVKASIQDLRFTGVKEAFIGKIEPDDDNPAVFTLLPDRSGSFNYILRIDYEDDFGKHYMEEDLVLVVRPGDGSTLIIIFFLLVIGSIIFLYYRKRLKRESSE
jgi:hypothetical protein